MIDYDSPLSMSFVSEISNEIAKITEDGVMNAVVRAGFDIDKDKLIKILQQDRERYEQAYRKGSKDGYIKREDEIVRCKDCENFVWNSISQNAGSCGIGIGDGRNHWHSKDWYCANGVKKE